MIFTADMIILTFELQNKLDACAQVENAPICMGGKLGPWFQKLLIIVAVLTILTILYLLPKAKKTVPRLPQTKPWVNHMHNEFHPKRNYSNSNDFGYVMAVTYGDQMTGSMANVISFQCWAGTLGTDVRVVEPFLVRSLLGVNMYAATYNGNTSVEENNSVKLSDIYDREKWEKVTRRRGYAPFVSWKYFLENAQRKLILVGQECIGKEGSRRVIKCSQRYRKFTRDGEIFAKKHGFQIVRTIGYPPSVLSEQRFKRLIYGDYDPLEVAVIFSIWGGVHTSDLKWRVGISGSRVNRCFRGSNFIEMPVSSTVIQDSLKYNRKYLPNASSKGYISVMIRTEHFIIKHNLVKKAPSKEQVLSTLMKCYKNIQRKVNELKKLYGIDAVFLTLDCRKQGSNGFSEGRRTPLYKSVADTVSELYQMLYGNSSTLGKWDESFDTTASFTTPGYVAMLQKHMAAKGTCLLTAGGGIFQSSSHGLYSKYHPKGPKCVSTVNNC